MLLEYQELRELPDFCFVFFWPEKQGACISHAKNAPMKQGAYTLHANSAKSLLHANTELITPHDQTSWDAADDKCAPPQQRDTVTYVERCFMTRFITQFKFRLHHTNAETTHIHNILAMHPLKNRICGFHQDKFEIISQRSGKNS